MSEKEGERCWDCPDRTGASRVFGRVMLRISNRSSRLAERLEEQRDECPGAVPVKRSTQSTSGVDVSRGGITITAIHHDTYVARCPRKVGQVTDVPPGVEAAMRVNNLPVFIYERTDIQPMSREGYDERTLVDEPPAALNADVIDLPESSA